MAENKDSKTTYNVDTKYCKYVLIGDNITVNVYSQKDGEPRSTAVASEEEEPPGTSKPSPEYDDPTQCLVVQKEMDMNAGREENEVNENNSVLESHPSGSETTVKPEADTTGSRKPTQESQKPRRSFKLLLKRGPGRKHEVQSEVLSRTNPGYNGTLPLSRKFVPTSDKMCYRCIMTDETHLPQGRDKWPIGKIENGCFEVICNLLDLHYLSKELPFLSALGCFTQNEATSITQEFKATRGKGMANKALGVWGTSHRKNNVGALKKIVKCTMKRFDVLCVIENWEKLSVCHGCGINLQEPP